MEFSFLEIRSSIKYFELIAAILGIIYYQKYNKGFIKYFLIILCYTVVNEFLGLYLRKAGFKHNYIIYNVYHFINFSFLFLLYKNYLKRADYKKLCKLFLYIFFIVFALNMFFENYFEKLLTLPFIVGALLLIIVIFFYFLEILFSDRIFTLEKNLLFWISIGNLLYFVGKIPMRLIRNYWEELAYFESIFIVESCLSIIMYICFIIGLIWSEKQ